MIYIWFSFFQPQRGSELSFQMVFGPNAINLAVLLKCSWTRTAFWGAVPFLDSQTQTISLSFLKTFVKKKKSECRAGRLDIWVSSHHYQNHTREASKAHISSSSTPTIGLCSLFRLQGLLHLCCYSLFPNKSRAAVSLHWVPGLCFLLFLLLSQHFLQPLDPSSSPPRLFWMAGLPPLLLSLGEVGQALIQHVFHFWGTKFVVGRNTM